MARPAAAGALVSQGAHPRSRRRDPGEKFPRSDRLRRRTEFRQAQSRGSRVHTRHFILLLLPREAEGTRLGITVTRKVGGAVQRNRVKRMLREVFRRNRAMFPERCDLVCIAKRGAPELGYRDVAAELSHAKHAMHRTVRRARNQQGQRKSD